MIDLEAPEVGVGNSAGGEGVLADLNLMAPRAIKGRGRNRGGLDGVGPGGGGGSRGKRLRASGRSSSD